MGNHFHLAVETPEGNLSEGMRWLQSVFANRFNRFHGAGGHLFQGRFKSLRVEDDARLAWLCHYIHLNPVRAGLCQPEALLQHRWSSVWYASRPKVRPASLRLGTCLSGAGGLADTAAGWRKYVAYLAWLQENEPARKQMEFERMSRGWAIGSVEFRQALAADEKQERLERVLTQAEAREARQMRWAASLERCLERLRKTEADARRERKGAAWKAAIAAFMKAHEMTSNRWLSERLHMGTVAGVSRYAAAAMRAEDRQASNDLKRLSAILKH